MSGASHATIPEPGPATGSVAVESPPPVPQVQDNFAQKCSAILERCQNGSLLFVKGLTEVFTEAAVGRPCRLAREQGLQRSRRELELQLKKQHRGHEARART